MTLLYDGIIAFLAAVGLSALVWLLSGALLGRRKRGYDAAVVIRARGDGQELPAALDAACAAAARLGPYTLVAIWDDGLDENGRCCARTLAQSRRHVSILENQTEIFT